VYIQIYANYAARKNYQKYCEEKLEKN